MSQAETADPQKSAPFVQSPLVMDEAAKRQFVARHSDDRLSAEIARFIGFLRDERGMSANTLRAYTADLVGFIDFCEQEQALFPDSLDHRMLRRYLGWLQKNQQARSTVARKTASLRALMRFFVTHGILAENPSEMLKNPRGERHLPTFLEVPDIMKLFGAPEIDTLEGLRDRAILEVLYDSGMRVGELVALNLRDLDLEHRTIRVTGKGSRERIAHIGAACIITVREYLDRRAGMRIVDGDAVFLNRQGTRLSDRSVRRLFAKYVAKAGLNPAVSPHTLRHSCATHMLNSGSELSYVQEILGHADIATTQIYTHVSTRRLDSQYRKHHPRATTAPDDSDTLAAAAETASQSESSETIIEFLTAAEAAARRTADTGTAGVANTPPPLAVAIRIANGESSESRGESGDDSAERATASNQSGSTNSGDAVGVTRTDDDRSGHSTP